MKSNEIFEEIGKLIAQDELDLVIKKLQTFLKGSSLLDELILQSARYNGVMKQIRLDTISFEDANLTRNKIRYALIDMLRIIEESAEDNPEIGKEVEKVNAEKSKRVIIKNSKNVNTGNVNTGGGDFHIGDN